MGWLNLPLSAIFFLIVLSMVWSCHPLQETEQRVEGDTLVIAEYQTPSLINPILTTSTISAQLSEILFDGLVRVNERGEIIPHLALSYKVSTDGRLVSLVLRKGVKFHDGEELTAEDVKFTFDTIRDTRTRSPYAFGFKDTERITIKDRYTLEISLKKPLSSFLYYLDVGILPKHLLEKEDLMQTQFNDHPIGTGPFQFVTRSEDQILLEANKGHFQGRPYLDRIIVRVYPNQKTAWARLMSEEVDFFHLLTPENYAILEKTTPLRGYSFLKPFYYLISFNRKNPLFEERGVREALNYAINKEEILARVLKGRGRISAGTIYPGSWAYNKGIQPYPYDPQKAQALLHSAGWEDRDGDHILEKGRKKFEFTIIINRGDDLKERAALSLQQQLLDIGMKAQVLTVPTPEVLSLLSQKEFDAVFMEIFAKGDPDFSYRFWHSSEIGEGLNFFSYKNDTVDKLLDQGRATPDQERRKEIYARFQEEILKDPPGIFLFWTDHLIGIHKRFKGVNPAIANDFTYIRDLYVPTKDQKHPDLQ